MTMQQSLTLRLRLNHFVDLQDHLHHLSCQLKLTLL